MPQPVTPDRSPSDLVALLHAVGAGDREAFARLYAATAPKLLGIALRILRDRQAAEDAVQEAYVAVWQNARRYSAEAGRPMTWLITIARNRSIDAVRRRREVPAPLDEEGLDAASRIPDPLDREAAFVDADRLSICLGRLDQAQRDCFVLAYLDGYSREELALRFERPVNTIKTWLHRSAGALRACLQAP